MRRALDIAGKEDEAPGGGLAKKRPLIVGQFGPFRREYDGKGHGRSRVLRLATYSLATGMQMRFLPSSITAQNRCASARLSNPAARRRQNSVAPILPLSTTRCLPCIRSPNCRPCRPRPRVRPQRFKRAQLNQSRAGRQAGGRILRRPALAGVPGSSVGARRHRRCGSNKAFPGVFGGIGESSDTAEYQR